MTDTDRIDTSALEAAVPARDGAFSRVGFPWANIPYATNNSKWFKENDILWKMQATQDESFLYIRFEAKASLPTPGMELPAEDVKSFKGIPAAPDSLAIETAEGKKFELQVADNPMTRSTFDESGRATSNRYFMEYSFIVRNPNRDSLFSDETKDSFEALTAVQDRDIDIKLPLKALGINPVSSAVEIVETNSLAKLLPYQVGRFSQ